METCVVDRLRQDPNPGEEYRAEVLAFLGEHLPKDWRGAGAMPREEYPAWRQQWRALLAEHRMIAPSWPAEYGGGGRTPLESAIQAEEFARAGVPRGGVNDQFGVQLIGSTLLAIGTEEQKRRFLPGIVDGTYLFCQGFSEPGSGSDLASISTRAQREGDEWVITGEKIWTSNAMTANWIFVLCRTEDGAARRHDGLSLLLAPLEQDGIERRPIDMMNGVAEFCQTTFTGGRTEVGLEVGGPGGGWAAATCMLNFERGETTATMPVRFRTEIDRLRTLLAQRGADADPVVRQELAWCWSRVEMMRLSGLHNLARWARGEPIGPESALEKLFWSELHGKVTALACRVLGAEATTLTGREPNSYFLCDDPGVPADSACSWVKADMGTMGERVAAGTSEIQRNIIAERILGLPR